MTSHRQCGSTSCFPFDVFLSTSEQKMLKSDVTPNDDVDTTFSAKIPPVAFVPGVVLTLPPPSSALSGS